MISNYAELQAKLASYLHRDDLTAMIPDFISLAEVKFNRKLRLRAQETTVTGDVAATVALPDDFLELISLTVTTGGCTYPVSYRPTGKVTGESGGTYYYTTVGGDLKFEPVDASATYTLTYYAKFDLLADSVNWLITNAPDLYLYSALLEAEPYIQNDERMIVWAQLRKSVLDDLETADRNARYGNNLRMVVG